MGSELQLERALDMCPSVLVDVTDSEAGLVHVVQIDRRNPSFVTYSSLPGTRRGVCAFVLIKFTLSWIVQVMKYAIPMSLILRL